MKILCIILKTRQNILHSGKMGKDILVNTNLMKVSQVALVLIQIF